MSQKMSLFSVVLFFLSCAASAGIEFEDHETSWLVLGDEGVVDLSANPLVVTGRIEWDSASGRVVNGPLLYRDGTLGSIEGGDATLSNVYYADIGEDSILAFEGDSLLVGRDGYRMLSAFIGGTGNEIRGDVILTAALTVPAEADLTLSITRPLTQRILLDSSELFLGADLVCGDNVCIVGTGAVSTQDYTLTLAARYTSDVEGALTWNDVKGMYIRGNLPLAADWTFSGTSHVDGDGAIIDLTRGGSITVGANSVLILEDVTLRGVTNESLVFGDEDSELHLRGCRLEFADDYAIVEGTVIVTQDSMFVLRGYDVTFDGIALLSVQYATLVLNVLSNDTDPYANTLYAPTALFVDHAMSADAFATNVEAGNLETLHGGVIAELNQIVGAAGGGSGLLDGSGVMATDDSLHFTVDTLYGAGGAKVIFSNPGTAQFIVDPGVEVVLENLELQGITATTFSLGDGSRVLIGENVTFELAEDIAWPTKELVIQDSSSFTIRSASGVPRVFSMESDPIGGSTPEDYEYLTHLDLGTGSLVLENVILKGLRHVVFGMDDTGEEVIYGGIILHGDASIEDDRLVIDHHFVVAGTGNMLRLRSDEMTFDGSISFDPVSVSALTVLTVLPSTFYGTPRVHFGSGVLNVSSEIGQACLFFDAPKIQVVNNAADSFSLGSNGVLAGHTVDIDLYPIMQESARVLLRPGLRITSALSAGAFMLSEDLLDAMRSPFAKRAMTSWERARREQRFATRGVDLVDESLKPIVHYDSAVSLPQMAGNITLRDTQATMFTNWRVSDVRAVNCTLYDGVNVQQSSAATTIKSDDIINVIGGTMHHPNTIYISNDLTIDGALNLDDNAVLCITVAPGSAIPTITFSDSSSISWGAGSVLILRGQGNVAIPDSWSIDFADTDSQFVFDDGMQLVVPYGHMANLTGAGTLVCQNSAQITVANEGRLRCGMSIDDAVSLRVKTGGTVIVGDLLASVLIARLSLVGVGSSLDCSQGGLLAIGQYGEVELNSLDKVAKPGYITSCNFGSGGGLYIAKQGALYLTSNNGGVDGLSFLFEGGSIGGSGVIGVLGNSFQGKIQPNIGTYRTKTATLITAALVQTMPTLVASTLFINGNDEKILRTKNGVLVTLGINDVIISDSADGTVRGRQALSGRNFTYNANGVRS